MKHLLFLSILAFLALSASAQDKPPYEYDKADVKETESGLRYVVIKEGKGRTAQQGDNITAHYHGMLENGKVFDSSFDRGEPFKTAIGVGRVIKGWDEAFQMFHEGTRAVLIIPSELGYGDRGMPAAGIPGGATLIFHVELLEVERNK